MIEKIKIQTYKKVHIILLERVCRIDMIKVEVENLTFIVVIIDYCNENWREKELLIYRET